MQERPLDPPEGDPYTGRVVFTAYINDEAVEVEGDVHDGTLNINALWVWYGPKGKLIDVNRILTEAQLVSINQQFDANAHDICGNTY